MHAPTSVRCVCGTQPCRESQNVVRARGNHGTVCLSAPCANETSYDSVMMSRSELMSFSFSS